jgi:hypothetical protein
MHQESAETISCPWHSFDIRFQSNHLHECNKKNPVTIEEKNCRNDFWNKHWMSQRKVTCSKSNPVNSNYIEVPKELLLMQQHVTLCIDTINISRIPIFTTVSRNVQNCTIKWVPSLNTNAYRSALECIFAVYKHASFIVTQVNCDNKYCPVNDKTTHKHGIAMTFASA